MYVVLVSLHLNPVHTTKQPYLELWSYEYRTALILN